MWRTGALRWQGANQRFPRLFVIRLEARLTTRCPRTRPPGLERQPSVGMLVAGYTNGIYAAGATAYYRSASALFREEQIMTVATTSSTARRSLLQHIARGQRLNNRAATLRSKIA